MSEQESRAWRVEGIVQGVGFRVFVLRRASALSLKGWVCNHPDGWVEVQARGPASALDKLEEDLWHGFERTRVASVTDIPAASALEQSRSFEIE